MSNKSTKAASNVNTDLLQLESDTNKLQQSLLLDQQSIIDTQQNDNNNVKSTAQSNNKVHEFKTFKLPESSLLSRLDAFLPTLKQSNTELLQQIQLHGSNKQYTIDNHSDSESDTEHNENEQKQHIEMDLMLGVLEAQKPDDSNNHSKNDTENKPLIQEVNVKPNTRQRKRSKTKR